MIRIAPATNFLAELEGAQPNNTAALQVSIVRPPNTVLYGPSNAGVVETVVGVRHTGSYTVPLTSPATPGEYLVVWDDGVNPTYNEQLEVTLAPLEPASGDQNYLPAVAQVAQHDMSRTRDQFGNLLGTFTSTTQPTDDQVAQLIFTAATKVADEVGDTVPEKLRDDAADVVALRTAMMIELDFFAEQVNTGRSIYPQLKSEYEEELTKLQAAIIAIDETGNVVDAGPAGRPSYYFPEAKTGWDTRW
jgi:hypothetical protein